MNKDKQQDIELEILYRISQAMAHQHDVAALLNEVLDILETEKVRKISLSLTMSMWGTLFWVSYIQELINILTREKFTTSATFRR